METRIIMITYCNFQFIYSCIRSVANNFKQAALDKQLTEKENDNIN